MGTFLNWSYRTIKVFAKGGNRKRNGCKSFGRILQVMLAETSMVKNLNNPEYLKIILSGKSSLAIRVGRFRALGKLNYSGSDTVESLAEQLKQGQVWLLMTLTGCDEDSCRAFTNEGPFHWTMAAKQLAYWSSEERGNLPPDLYDEGVKVWKDPEWNGEKRPLPWPALEEQWYHASLMGYLLSHRKER